MNIKFYLISISIFFITYLFTIILKNQINHYIEKVMNNKFKNNDSTNKTNILYYYILLFLIIWITILKLYIIYNPYSILLGKNQLIYQLGIYILLFLSGVIYAQGKNLLIFLYTNFIHIIKTIILTGTYIILLNITKNNYFWLIFLLSFINMFYIIDFLIYFEKEKEKMKTKEFILNFIWLLWINFGNSFILIYSFINK